MTDAPLSSGAEAPAPVLRGPRVLGLPLLDGMPLPVRQGLSQESIGALAQAESPKDLVELFPVFYAADFVQLMASSPRWTVSDAQKVPLDARGLLELGRVRGAFSHDEECLVDLPTLMAELPTAANHALRVRAQIDGYLVLDVEKSAEDGFARECLTQLPWIYAERSMSGLGYHLVLPLPDSYHDWPLASRRPALKDPGGDFEVIANQFVTFTREAIDPAVRAASPEEAALAWSELYAMLAEPAERIEDERRETCVSTARPDHPYLAMVAEDLAAVPADRTLEELGHDHSKLHFHLLGKYRRALPKLQQLYSQLAAFDDEPFVPWDDAFRAWAMRDALEAVVPRRSKNDEVNNGKDTLLRRAEWSLGTEPSNEQQAPGRG